MRLTRGRVRAASRSAERVWSVSGFRERYESEARRSCRAIVTRNPHHNVNRLLARVDFFEDADHWAHTDGERIWINQCRAFTPATLCWTLVHETMHGAFLVRGRELSEWREHRIMERVDRRLVE